VFGVPVLHDDDALRALRAAADIRGALTSLNDDLERDFGLTTATRTGVITGEVVTGDPSTGQRLTTGDAVNTAARLEQAADPGEILIGVHTYRLARAAVVAELLEDRGPGYKVSPSDRAPRSVMIPCRMRLLAVPSGTPSSSATREDDASSK